MIQMRSNMISLVVLGSLTTTLSGCDVGDLGAGAVQQDLRQGYYTTLEDCQHDWGQDRQDCQPASGAGSTAAGGTGAHGGGGYVGPRYYWDRSIGHPVAVASSGETRVLPNSYISRAVPSAAKSVTVSHVSRGGFGSTAHGFSSAGG